MCSASRNGKERRKKATCKGVYGQKKKKKRRKHRKLVRLMRPGAGGQWVKDNGNKAGGE